ncbi:hypothetical protein AMJ49_03105 [Parcubacteria bacterium DG_74_2]|nr:MAG: hypothetical protein AMJ49_03105 [Parcubacteria bacterium DG_74_2]
MFFKIIRNHFFPGVIALIYHRVLETEIDSQLLCVPPENFEKQMRYLKDNFEILKVSELLKILKEKKVFQKGILITFDDGYADNFYFALPILERLKIPATFFVCSGNIDKNEEFWSHQLEQIFFLNKKLPDKLQFESNGKKYLFNTSNSQAIKKTYQELHKIIKSLNKKNRDNITNFLFEWSGVVKKTRKYYRTLSTDELKKMASFEYIEIGGHTVNHVLLSALNKTEQKEEIKENKKHLEKILNKKVITFSYPYGRKKDYNQDSLEIVKNNYQIVFSNFPGVIRNNSNIYELPRFLIRNWDIEIFKRKIRNFFISS